MNKLKTDIPGGFPFVLDDLRFMDESTREVLTANFQCLENADDGIMITKETIDNQTEKYFIQKLYNFQTPNAIDPFFVFYQNELFFVENIPTTTGVEKYIYFEPEITTTQTAPGTKTFEDGSVHETYEIRRGKMVFRTSTQTNGVLLFISQIWDGGWVLNSSVLFSEKLAKYTGSKDILNAFKTYKTDNDNRNTTNETAIQTNATEIENLKSIENELTSEWTRVESKIVDNRNDVGIALLTDFRQAVTDLSLFSIGDSASQFIKYKLIGNTISVAVQNTIQISNNPNPGNLKFLSLKLTIDPAIELIPGQRAVGFVNSFKVQGVCGTLIAETKTNNIIEFFPQQFALVGGNFNTLFDYTNNPPLSNQQVDTAVTFTIQFDFNANFEIK